jgi:TonB family protein
MHYYEEDERGSKAIATIAVVVYAAFCVAIMFVSLVIEVPQPQTGILIDFGVAAPAGGTADIALVEKEAQPTTPKQRPPAPEEPIMTTQRADAPEVVQSTKPESVKPVKTEEAPAKPREVNKKALFPGRTVNSTSPSEGASEGQGNEGAPQGAPEGDVKGTGGDSSGQSFDLAGRYMVEPLQRPDYNGNEEGRVVIRITVDKSGKVTGATYQQKGSTTNNGRLVEAARKAALRTKFTASETDIQSGTITYVFKIISVH